MKLLKYIFILLIIFFLKSCANQNVPITGGPKDTMEPKVKFSHPKENTVNFTEQSIVIHFNEPIQLSSSSESFYIIPKTKKPPRLKSSKSSISVEFNEELEKNTTYTLYFNDAIKDITESNSIKQLTYTFSTGPYIDSLKVSGKVKNLWTNNYEKNILVGLYKSIDTNTINNASPDYYAYTSEDGTYNLKYIKEGKYNLFALKDENKSMKYDQQKELVGFLKELTVSKDTSKIDLLISKIDTTAPKIVETNNEPAIYSIKLTEGIVAATLKNNIKIKYSVSGSKNSINFYNTENITDSIDAQISVTDSLNNTGMLKHRFAFKPMKKNEKYKSLISQINPIDKINPFKPEFNIDFNYPVDTVLIPVTFYVKNKQITPIVKWENNKTRLLYQLPVNQEDTIKAIIPDSTFISDFNANYNADTLLLPVNKESEYGIIEGKVLHDNRNFQVQLIKSNTLEVVQFVNNKSEFQFTGILPGEYQIRTVIDVNKNGYWDQGNIEKNIQAEPLLFHKEIIKVKANWEIKGIEIRI